MKRYLYLLLSLFLASAVYAQERTPLHELFVGYGVAPVLSMPDPSLPTNTVVNAPYSANNKRFSGTLNVGYLFHVSKPLAIGVDYSYLSVKRDIVLGSSIPLGKIKNDCHVAMFTGKYFWLCLKRLSFYSRVGVGLAVIKKGELDVFGNSKDDLLLKSARMEDDKSVAWQAMPIGLEWRFAGHLALFAEAGAGSAGCGMAGLKVSF